MAVASGQYAPHLFKLALSYRGSAQKAATTASYITLLLLRSLHLSFDIDRDDDPRRRLRRRQRHLTFQELEYHSRLPGHLDHGLTALLLDWPSVSLTPTRRHGGPLEQLPREKSPRSHSRLAHPRWHSRQHRQLDQLGVAGHN